MAKAAGAVVRTRTADKTIIDLVNIVVSPIFRMSVLAHLQLNSVLCEQRLRNALHSRVIDQRESHGPHLGMKQQQTNDGALATLMQAAHNGDTHAYSQLLNEITPRLRQIIQNRRRFLQPADIEDIVQDVLLSLHAVRATYDPQRPFMPWLLAITRNRLADGARRYARRTVHEVQVETLPVTLFEAESNIHSEAYRDPEALKQAIQALPSGQREAVEMLKLREMR